MGEYSRVVRLWQSFKIVTAADLDKHLDSFRVLFAFHSGKIENDEISYDGTKEIFENGRILNYSGSPRTLLEQQNQKLCYDFLKEKTVRAEPLSVGLVKEVHKVLTGGTYDERRYINKERPGEFKKHDYITGLRNVGTPAENVKKELTELLAEVDEYKGKEVLKAATYFHAGFEFIHPFADGNGRVGRTLTNYYLMTRNHPPLIVHDEDKRNYYACLQKYDEVEELDPLYEFFKHEVEKTWEKALAGGMKTERRGLSGFTE